ncbi:MAG TPA: sirohydrochlorin chelatase [Nocardioidaceae bacterium]|nr:sirohydrochlorin chelatase [Nocardioidaceae bacterium]
MSAPNLVAVAHGTRNPDGPAVIDALLAQVRRRLPDTAVHTSYVELNEPLFSDVMAAQDGPTVVVPLLLSTGYHVNHDLPEQAAAAAGPVRIARPLGPHPLLAALMCQRLQAAGARRGDAVVMVAAGSRDADGIVDTLEMGRVLQAHWGAPVQVAHLSGHGLRVNEAVEQLWSRGHRRIAAVPYLLAPGFFARKARAQASVAGCTAVATELGAHRLVAELVVRRYLATASPSAAAGASTRVA